MQQECLDRIYSPKMEYYRTVFKNSVRWDGFESLRDKTVIVYCEQGFGDIIQFARYIPYLKLLHCKTILYCPKDLHRLFTKCLSGVDEILDKDTSVLPPHDYHVLTMSLPFILSIVDVEIPYLHVSEYCDLEEIKDYKKIGIVWEGNPEHSNNDERCCPLSVFRRIHSLKNVKLISLQKTIHNSKYTQGCEDFELYGSQLDDYYDTAKLINSLDLVIAIDTSVLHLAGAMSKPTLGILSHKHDPRWDLDINWYPSITLLSQPEENDWLTIESKILMHTNMFLTKLNTTIS